MDEDEERGFSRRGLITGVGAGAAMAWVAPVVTRVGLARAAASGEPEPAGPNSFVLSTLDGGVQYLGGFHRPDPASFLTNVEITGVPTNTLLKGIDFRPGNGLLYGLARMPGNGGQLFVIDPLSGVAVAQHANALAGFTLGANEQIGIDFDPVADVLRIVITDRTNIRIDPGSLTVTVDSLLAYTMTPVAPAPRVSGAAYTSSVATAITTTLYDIDSRRNELVIQDPPDAGALTVVGPTVSDPRELNGFDIVTVGVVDEAYAVYRDPDNASNPPELYRVDLTLGSATAVGTLGTTFAAGGPAPKNVTGLALRI